MLNEAFVKS